MNTVLVRLPLCLAFALSLCLTCSISAYATDFSGLVEQALGSKSDQEAQLDQFINDNPGVDQVISQRINAAKDQGRKEGRADRDKQQAKILESLIDEIPVDAGIADRDAIMAAAYASAAASSEARNLVPSDKVEKLEAAVERMNADNANLGSIVSRDNNGWLVYVVLAWEILWIVQVFFAYGTAYRRTKKGGDNGIALFGWMFAYSLAAIVPFLGIYLWHRSKEQDGVLDASSDTKVSTV